MLFPLPSFVVRFVDDDFMKRFDDPSLNPTHALPSFWHAQEVNSYVSARVGWFTISFVEEAVERAKEFKVLGRKRGTDGALLLSETPPEVVVTCSSEEVFS